MEEISLRDARPADAEGLARVHAHVARYYAEQGPRYFDGGELMLVAEIDGEIGGALAARLVAPASANGPAESETRCGSTKEQPMSLEKRLDRPAPTPTSRA